MTRVYLSLGSNLGDRLALLRAAVQRLRDAADVELVTASPLYESEPWEEEPGRASSEQRWYLNCVLAVDTPLPPRALLERLHGEIKRRIRAVGAFPDRASALRLVTVVALRTTGVWADRRYLDMSLLDETTDAKEIKQAA